ncbi:hypothetical protein [Paraburkholderia strydomiana]|uniref:hypothetical protein n=1 Tax=Paraburkholderia strydomiana TaxID=1245417 RepID=UPI001BEBF6F9|nr:hypothetical protein [Paraburkholderia strydomiana]MBT2794304.1 hypothetical protein [Paraburkholderia strydomiana]
MGKKLLSDDDGASNETTEQALTALTIQIKEFVQNRSLDSRCAAKLVKRLKKEADNRQRRVRRGHGWRR